MGSNWGMASVLVDEATGYRTSKNTERSIEPAGRDAMRTDDMATGKLLGALLLECSWDERQEIEEKAVEFLIFALHLSAMLHESLSIPLIIIYYYYCYFSSTNKLFFVYYFFEAHSNIINHRLFNRKLSKECSIVLEVNVLYTKFGVMASKKETKISSKK